MNKTSRVVLFFSSAFMALFFFSILVPDRGANAAIRVDQESSIAEITEEELEQERLKYYKSFEEDKREYYRDTAPHDVDDPDFFQKSHPLQEGKLPEKPLQEKPLREKPLQENRLQPKQLR